MKPIFVNRSVKHVLTPEELDASGKALAKSTAALKYTEEEKKAITADFSSKISQLEAEISIFADRVNNGHCYQTMKCQVEFDWKEGKKHVIHPETGEVLESAEITEDERQLEFTEQ